MREHPFHMSVNIMSRTKGHNVVAAAAYRAGEQLSESHDLINEGNSKKPKSIIYDYSRRHGIMSSFMMAPKDAPAWATDRKKIWDKVEKSEKRVDAQLAREIVVSLPNIDIFNHLNEKNKLQSTQKFYENILRRYVNDNFVKEGMIADIALHKPSEKNDDRNYHAHIMLTMRKVDKDEKFGFGAKERGWNSPAKLENWRKEWCHLINTTLKNNRIDAFIDHRSYEERGLDIGATIPLGKYNSQLEKRGVKTKVGNDNRKVLSENKVDHKYLEKVFENSPMAPEHEILGAIKKAGYEDPKPALNFLEEQGILIPLNSQETGKRSGLWENTAMKRRNDEIKKISEVLHQRESYDLPIDIVQNITKKRGDKKVREALNYTAQPQGFKVIESESNGHKNTYLSSCREMYQSAGYDVIAVARDNDGKKSFKTAGFEKGVLTYRDLLRRFGSRYTGAKSSSQKVIIVDEADQLSPLQDLEIFNTAKKINAKLIYLGGTKNKNKRSWQSQFSHYRLLTTAKRLREKFLRAQNKAKHISDTFSNARILEVLSLQNQGRAKYINSYDSAATAKQGVLNAWFTKMQKRHDNRFILAASDKDVEVFNFAIQQKRLEKKHLTEKYGKAFSIAYPSDDGSTLRRDMFVHRGEQIQFKKAYKKHGIEEGTRATVRIHYSNNSLLELDDGRVIKVNLREANGFDLGYAGRSVSPNAKNIDQGFIYHSKANALDDAPLLYQNSKTPVKIFYSEKQAKNLEDLSSQLLGRRHGLYEGFSEVSGNDSTIDKENNPDSEQIDDNLDVEPD